MAESLGYSTLVLSDHLLNQFSPLVALAAAAQATSTLRLGTFALNNVMDALLDSPHVFIGSVDELEQKCIELRERFCISYILALGDFKAFAPVVERLAGR